MKTFAAAIALATATVLPAGFAHAQDTAAAPVSTDWIETSNAYTQKLIEFEAGFYPEGASSSGYEQYDGQTFDYSPTRPSGTSPARKRCGPNLPRRRSVRATPS